MSEETARRMAERKRWTRVALFTRGSALVLTAVAGLFRPWGSAGLSPILPALLGHCPACRALGIDSGQDTADATAPRPAGGSGSI
jgi:hypothetical protein